MVQIPRDKSRFALTYGISIELTLSSHKSGARGRTEYKHNGELKCNTNVLLVRVGGLSRRPEYIDDGAQEVAIVVQIPRDKSRSALTYGISIELTLSSHKSGARGRTEYKHNGE